jgi:hypothetical protein
MKKYFLLLLVLCCLPVISFSQSVSCEDLIDYVKEEGHSEGEVSSFTLALAMDKGSSWLKEVKGYSLENNYIVIAEIKKDEFGFSTAKYIFCGIPSSNWRNFKNGLSDLGMSYGEKFHKYIIDYKCKCN